MNQLILGGLVAKPVESKTVENVLIARFQIKTDGKDPMFLMIRVEREMAERIRDLQIGTHILVSGKLDFHEIPFENGVMQKHFLQLKDIALITSVAPAAPESKEWK